jgi:ribonuclease H2 subunit B
VKNLQEELAAMVVVETEKGRKKTTKAIPEEGTNKKRKTKGSHGVEVLKKANVEGMQKISSFFQKKP